MTLNKYSKQVCNPNAALRKNHSIDFYISLDDAIEIPLACLYSEERYILSACIFGKRESAALAYTICLVLLRVTQLESQSVGRTGDLVSGAGLALNNLV